MPEGLDRLLTLRELADYLQLGERTVLKLANSGELPGARVGNQWRFKQSVIDAWLDEQMLGASARFRPPPAELASITIEDCFAVGHVVPVLAGQSRPAVLEELARLAADLGLVRDARWFLGALLEREHVLTSAIGDGIALAHTLHRHPEQVHRPFVLLGRSLEGVDFEAPDRRPVHLVVVIGLRYQELHLPWLARLSAAFKRPQLRAALMAGDADAARMRTLILEALALGR